MREDYLKTDQYPTVSYSGKLLECPEFQNGESVAIVAGGIFSLHGTEREIFINGKITPEGERMLIEASRQILLSDYNINRMNDEMNYRYRSKLF